MRRPYTLADLRGLMAQCLGADGGAEIDESAVEVRFVDLGFDSLSIYELMTRLQDDVGVPISDEEVDRLATPRLVIEFVNARTQAS